MVLLSLSLVFGAAVALLFVWFRRIENSRTLWRTAIFVGLVVGLARASLACVGWYVVERTGGTAQIPGFLLAMLSWPEAVILPRHRTGVTPMSTYAQLFVLLVVSSMALVAAIARASWSARR
jgi:hypothetical protein